MLPHRSGSLRLRPCRGRGGRSGGSGSLLTTGFFGQWTEDAASDLADGFGAVKSTAAKVRKREEKDNKIKKKDLSKEKVFLFSCYQSNATGRFS